MTFLNTLLPLTASIISFIFAFIVFKRYFNRRGPHLLRRLVRLSLQTD